MAFLTVAQKKRIKKRIAAKEAALTALDAAYLEASTEIKEYRFDSGEGSQRVAYRNLDDLRNQISALEAEIDALYRKLSGTGVVNMSLRRNG